MQQIFNNIAKKKNSAMVSVGYWDSRRLEYNRSITLRGRAKAEAVSKTGQFK